MHLDILTNPFVIGYAVVIILLYFAGSAVKREAQKGGRRRARRSVRDNTGGQFRLSTSQISINGHNATNVIVLRADWLAERKVWVSASNEFPVLNAEADTIDALAMKIEKLLSAFPQPTAGSQISAPRVAAVELVACRLLTVANQSSVPDQATRS